MLPNMAVPGSFPCPRCGELLPPGIPRCDACGAYLVAAPAPGTSARAEAAGPRHRPRSGPRAAGAASDGGSAIPSTAWVFLLVGLLAGGAIGYALHGSIGPREEGGMPTGPADVMSGMAAGEAGQSEGAPSSGMPAGTPPAGAQMPPQVVAMVQEYRNALDKNPDDVDANIGFGNLLFDSSQWQKAVDHYGRALAKAPGNADVRVDMAIALHNLGQDKRAREEIERVTREHPDHKNAWLNLGVVNATLGDRTGAIRAWERYLALDPNGPHTEEIQAQIEGLRKQ
jgi:cytochrome c-type biogenesis protein CcmH/NrfG